MATPVNIIDSVQQKYAALASFTGKPSELVFGAVWPRNSSGSLVGYPLIRFTHDGTPTETDFEHTAIEVWRFTFEIFSETPQQALTIFDRVRFDGQDPNADAPRTGFWYPTTVDMPAGYVFEQLVPVGDFVVESRDGQFAPLGGMVHVVTFRMELQAYRETFA